MEKYRPDRNIALEMIRVTEAAAIAAARWAGRGDKNAADGAAVDAMRFVLTGVAMDGIVVIGEGEKDEAPMLFNGEIIGNGTPPEVDVAVDPIDGTTLTAKGRKLMTTLFPLFNAEEVRVTSTLTSAETAEIAQALRKVVVAADPS